MRHLVSGRKLKRTSSHRRSLLRNLATALFEHKKLETTEAKAKELRPYAERLITKAKSALAREKQGLLPEGQTIDIHNRRIVSRYLSSKAVLQELFDTIAPAVETRAGGYTRIVKTGIRRGDASPMAIIELVDWSAPQDGAVSIKKRKKTTKAKKVTATKTKKTAKAEDVKPVEATPVAEEPEAIVEETVAQVEEATPETIEVIGDAPAEVVASEPETEAVASEPVAEANNEEVASSDEEKKDEENKA
jgi:large subunit ribosomal protein L17